MTAQTDATEQCPACDVKRAPLALGGWCSTCGWNPRREEAIADLRRQLEEAKAFKSAFPPVLDGKIARKMVEDRARAELIAESEQDAVSMMEVLEQRNDLQAEVERLKEENERWAVGTCEVCQHVYVGQKLSAGCSHCVLEDLQRRHDALREAANDACEWLCCSPDNRWHAAKFNADRDRWDEWSIKDRLRAALDEKG